MWSLPGHFGFGLLQYLVKSRRIFLDTASELLVQPALARLEMWTNISQDLQAWVRPREELGGGSFNRLLGEVARSRDNLLRWEVFGGGDALYQCGVIQTTVHLIRCPLGLTCSDNERDLAMVNERTSTMGRFWAGFV